MKNCKVCNKLKTQMYICGDCMQAKYCSEQCQAADWDAHAENCQQIGMPKRDRQEKIYFAGQLHRDGDGRDVAEWQFLDLDWPFVKNVEEVMKKNDFNEYHKRPIRIGSKEHLNGRAYMLYAKYLAVGDLVFAEEIRKQALARKSLEYLESVDEVYKNHVWQQANPATTESELEREVAKYDVEQWLPSLFELRWPPARQIEELRALIGYMYDSQKNPSMAKALMRTGANTELIFLSDDSPLLGQEESGEGDNWLGHLLVEQRDDLLRQQQAKLDAEKSEKEEAADPSKKGYVAKDNIELVKSAFWSRYDRGINRSMEIPSDDKIIAVGPIGFIIKMQLRNIVNEKQREFYFVDTVTKTGKPRRQKVMAALAWVHDEDGGDLTLGQLRAKIVTAWKEMYQTIRDFSEGNREKMSPEQQEKYLDIFVKNFPDSAEEEEAPKAARGEELRVASIEPSEEDLREKVVNFSKKPALANVNFWTVEFWDTIPTFDLLWTR